MTATLLSAKTVTARKTHACSTCNTTAIRPGEQYRRQVYAYDGTVYTWIACQPCNAIHDRVWQWASNWEGIDADDYAEWAEEYRDHATDGPAARAYLARLNTPKETS